MIAFFLFLSEKVDFFLSIGFVDSSVLVGNSLSEIELIEL